MFHKKERTKVPPFPKIRLHQLSNHNTFCSTPRIFKKFSTGLPPNFTTVHPKKGNIWKMHPNRGRRSEQQVDRRFRVPDFLLLISSAPTARQTPRPAWGSLQRFGCQCRLATPTTFSFSVNVPQTVCIFNATLLLHLHMKKRPSQHPFWTFVPQKMIWRIVFENQRFFFFPFEHKYSTG